MNLELRRSCRDCKKEKPLREFVKDIRCRAGRKNICKPCQNAKYKLAYAREYYSRHREEVKARKRERFDPKKEWSRQQRKYYGRPRDLARRVLRHAVQSGLIVKPGRCEDCQLAMEARKLHGHHDDYAKPLNVNWLCSICHGLRHRKEV